MEVRKESATVYTLNNRFGRDSLRFSIETRDGQSNYFIEYKGAEIMMNDDELYDFLEMMKRSYKIAVEEEVKNED